MPVLNVAPKGIPRLSLVPHEAHTARPAREETAHGVSTDHLDLSPKAKRRDSHALTQRPRKYGFLKSQRSVISATPVREVTPARGTRAVQGDPTD